MTDFKNTLLIIDDSRNNINLLQHLLVKAKFKILVARNGKTGIQIAELEQPDLILLDIMMPGMDGFEVCQHLKSQPNTQDIPIIFMTVLADTSAKLKGFELGAADYITRPFQQKEVLARVNAHLKLRNLQQQLVHQNVQLQQEIIERQQAQNALKISHERFLTVLNSLEAIVYVIDMQNHEILFANQYVKKIFQTENFDGKICWQAFYGQTSPCSFCNNAQLLTTEGQSTGVHSWEFQHPKNKRWYYIQNRAIRWTEGQWVRLEVATDITERKMAEQALQAREAHLKAIFDTAAVGIILLDSQGYFLKANATWAKMIGYSQEALLQLTISELTYPKDNPKSQKLRQQLVTGAIDSFRLEKRYLRKNGSIFWGDVSATSIRHPDGTYQSTISVIVDITERKQAEEALRASEERFELAVCAANEGLWDWNIETNQVYYSYRWKQILGYAEPELTDHPDEFFKRLHPEDISLVQDKITACIEQKIPTFEITIRLQHKEGHYVWILSRGIAIWNPEGKPLRMVGTNMDLTEQKQAEEALSKAKEAAEVANRAKSAFLANMSHELRTPLNGILGYAQLFELDKTLTSQQQEGIAVIKRSGEYLLTLVSDVLDLSKIEAERMELVPTDFGFERFLNGINDLFNMRAKQKGITFQYQPLTQLPTIIQADETRLRQILINLLSNAINFTKQGLVIFQVSAIPNQNNNHWKIHFHIEDTGIGIAPKELSKIFLPFQQGSPRNYQIQGTGLGLAICQKLVNMMAGEISVESTIGQGTIFSVELDLPEISSLTHPLTDKRVIKGFEGQKRKILIVDDQSENRLFLNNLLIPLGFEISEADDGYQSVDKAQQNLPDVILMDLIMPNQDGFEATRQIRKIPELKNVVIIALSASVFDYHRQHSLEVGCNDFIAKPVQTKVLLEKLQKHLHLNWIYEENATSISLKEGGISGQKEEDDDNEKIKGPSPKQATILFELTMKGDISGISNYIEQLEQTETTLQPFINKIKALAEELKVKQIRKIARYYKEAK
jgi:PAS domain S-box-containing protein